MLGKAIGPSPWPPSSHGSGTAARGSSQLGLPEVTPEMWPVDSRPQGVEAQWGPGAHTRTLFLRKAAPAVLLPRARPARTA